MAATSSKRGAVSSIAREIRWMNSAPTGSSPGMDNSVENSEIRRPDWLISTIAISTIRVPAGSRPVVSTSTTAKCASGAITVVDAASPGARQICVPCSVEITTNGHFGVHGVGFHGSRVVL